MRSWSWDLMKSKLSGGTHNWLFENTKLKYEWRSQKCFLKTICWLCRAESTAILFIFILNYPDEAFSGCWSLYPLLTSTPCELLLFRCLLYSSELFSFCNLASFHLFIVSFWVKLHLALISLNIKSSNFLQPLLPPASWSSSASSPSVNIKSRRANPLVIFFQTSETCQQRK